MVEFFQQRFIEKDYNELSHMLTFQIKERFQSLQNLNENESQVEKFLII